MSLVKVYHGQKGYDAKNEIKNFVFDPYAYFTDNYQYALHYTTNNNTSAVYEVVIDTSTLLDCRKLGAKKTYFEIIKNFLYKEANIFMTPEIKHMYMTGVPDFAFWEIIRSDDGRRFMPQFLKNGINGLRMLEEAQSKTTGKLTGEYYTSYVLFNNTPIKEIKRKRPELSTLIESVLNEAKQVGTLYHQMDGGSFLFMVKNDKLKNRYADKNKRGNIYFSRNKHYDNVIGTFKPMPYKIVVDGDMLSNNYKIRPRAENSWGGYKSESEEVVQPIGGEIPNIGKFIKEIWITVSNKDNSTKYNTKYQGRYNMDGADDVVYNFDSIRKELGAFLKKYPHIVVKTKNGLKVSDEQKPLRTIGLLNPKMSDLENKFSGSWFKGQKFELKNTTDVKNFITKNKELFNFSFQDKHGQEFNMTADDMAQDEHELSDLLYGLYNEIESGGTFLEAGVVIIYFIFDKLNRIWAHICYDDKGALQAKTLMQRIRRAGCKHIKLINPRKEFEKAYGPPEFDNMGYEPY